MIRWYRLFGGVGVVPTPTLQKVPNASPWQEALVKSFNRERWYLFYYSKKVYHNNQIPQDQDWRTIALTENHT